MTACAAYKCHVIGPASLFDLPLLPLALTPVVSGVTIPTEASSRFVTILRLPLSSSLFNLSTSVISTSTFPSSIAASSFFFFVETITLAVERDFLARVKTARAGSLPS